MTFSEKMMRQIRIGLVVWLMVWAAGCAWFQPQKEKTAEDLISEGMQNFERGKYRNATEAFQKLKDWYPFSKYAILAELKIADAHYHLEEYDEAIAAYQMFKNLHPRNEAMPYVIYQTGLCYFEQIDTIDRDQTATHNALETFKKLKKEYPNNIYTRKARKHVRKCRKTLAGHEFYVGLFYYKGKHYKTALSRFETVISDYSDIDDINEKAKHYIMLCEKSLKNQKSDEKIR